MSIRTSTSPGPKAEKHASARHRRENRLVRERTDGVTPRPRRNADERPRRFTHAVEFSKIDAGRAGNKKTSDSRQRPTDDSVRVVSDSFEGRSGVE